MCLGREMFPVQQCAVFRLQSPAFDHLSPRELYEGNLEGRLLYW